MARLLIGLTACLLTVFTTRAQDQVQLLTYHYPPLVELHGGRAPDGLSVQLIEQLFQRTGIGYRFVNQPPRRALYHATSQPDSCTFPVDRTQAREPHYRWIGPVAINRYAFYFRPDSVRPDSARPGQDQSEEIRPEKNSPDNTLRLVTLADAKGYTSAVFAGSGIGDYLKQNGFTVHQTNKIEQGLQMLMYNRVQLWVSDTHSAQVLARQNKITNLSPALTFFTSISFMACSRELEDDTYDKLQQVLAEMYREGAAQQILQLKLP